MQGLVTCDVESIGVDAAGYGALLSAQGKIQFDFVLWRTADDAYLVDHEAAYQDEFAKRLKLYRMRAQVEIAPQPDLAVWAAWGPALLHPLAALPPRSVPDPRLKELGVRIISSGPNVALDGEEPPQIVSEEAYTAHRHLYGVPEGRREFGYEKLFALEANLEEIGGVSFTKGCYVGQELTARMKHKTDLKKRLLPFSCSAAEEVEPASPIRAGEREIGQAIGGQGETVFALVRLDRLAGVLEGDLDVSAGDAPATLQWPAAYLTPPPR